MSLSKPQEQDMTLKNKVLVFTGTLMNFTREQAMELATMRGAICERAITSRTDYLIYGEKIGGTKTRAAQKYGVQMRSEQWLAAALLVNQPGFQPRKNTSALKDLSIAGPPPKLQPEPDVKPKGRRVRVL